MAKHKDFTVATDVQVYFGDLQKPPQRGSNENTNGLLRQYFPKNIQRYRLFPVGSEQSSAALKSTPTTNFRFSHSCE